MNVKRLGFGSRELVVVDAPIGITHAVCKIENGVWYELYKKSKVLETYCIDKNPIIDQNFLKKVINVGKLSIANESIVAALFNPVKNGKFWDYEHNGVFYPKAVLALSDVIQQECDFSNPFVVILEE
jgi:hypothetical protein